MTTRLQIVFICILLMALAKTSRAQTLDTLVRRFNHFREHALQEKIYAQLDRNFYLTGETLWFKVYTVDGSFHRPLDISKVAYAEILDQGNFPVLQGKIELHNGMGDGSFFLPASLSSGNYRIRFYTGWMKNFRPEFFYDEVITIVNPFVIPEAIQPKAAPSWRADFFPEGGNLVEGIRNKVGFKISDGAGKGVSGKGYIIDAENDTLSTFSPQNFGIGNFLFTPLPGHRYRAVLTDGTAVKGTSPFPPASPSGYVMQLLDSGDHVYVSVRSRDVAPHPLLLFVHARQIVAHAERQQLLNNCATFSVPKKDLHEGISHITLFNQELEPLCERLYFTYPSKELQIQISANQKSFNPRKRVLVSLQTKDSNAAAAGAKLSMAVYKVDSLSLRTRRDIFSHLWLNADLTGDIESPEYYFNQNNPSVKAAMDNLMLTHGWRRFDWKSVLKGKPEFSHLPEVRGHIVTGTISKDNKAQGGVFAYLGSPGKIIRAYGSWSNPAGKVRFEIKDFYGPRRIIIQTESDSAEAYDIKIQNPFSTATHSRDMPGWRLNDDSERELLARSIAMQVQDIYYYEPDGNRIIQPQVDSSAFYGQADATYFLDDYTRFPVMEEVMREYVPGVFVRKRRDGFHFLVVDQVNDGILPGDPMVLLDGVPILDVDDIMALDPLKVRKLEVVKRQYYLGQAVFFGIVSYTTYRGDLGGMEFDPHSISLNYDGLQLRREFYSPHYDRQQETTRMPDERYLLHWEPNITTDADGKHQLEFFTSDVPGTYQIVVEGLTAEGYSGSRTFTFTVNPADNP